MWLLVLARKSCAPPHFLTILFANREAIMLLIGGIHGFKIEFGVEKS